jgi:hypothetical protein
MRAPLVILSCFITISVAAAAAETPKRPQGERLPTGKALPSKRTAGANACAAYGAGFVRIEGTATCIKVGGWIDVGVATSSRR